MCSIYLLLNKAALRICAMSTIQKLVTPPSGMPGDHADAKEALGWLFDGGFYQFMVAAAIVSASACGLTLIFSSDPKTVDDAKRWLVNIVFAFAVYMAIKKWLYG